MPDTFKGIDGFGVDHYRPKKFFSQLITAYTNLYYCCNQCNRRKGPYWPAARLEATHFIPNPCDHVMFSHMQFQEANVRAKTTAGEVAVECLDLNDIASVEQRTLMSRLINLAERERAKVQGLAAKVETMRETDRIAPAAATDALAQLQQELSKLDSDLAKLRGD